MRDVTARAYDRMRAAIAGAEPYFAERGYETIDTPLLEETELFVRKSGGDLTNRLYTFEDPGGNRVSLRPEFTSSVIRHFIEERDSLSLPVRWQYGGPVFRYEPAGEGAFREFTQVGAELVGAEGPDADAETMHLAWSGLTKMGLPDCHLRVGHLGLLNALLSGYGLSDPARHFVIGSVQQLKRGEADVAALRKRADDVGLLRAGPDLGATPDWTTMEAAQEFVRRALRESMPEPVGQRTTGQIASRLLRKTRTVDNPDVFERALALVDELARLEGPAAAVLREARELAARKGISARPFDELANLVDLLTGLGVPRDSITIDVGLARGIAYYTGVIFELYASSVPGPSLGGGGRYDGLVKALGGGDDVPALGFAYNLDTVLCALDSVNEARPGASAR